MSQHYLEPVEPGNTVIVGYDRPFNSYFAQVYVADDKSNEGGPAHYLPDTKSILEVVKFVKPFASVPLAVVLELREELVNGANHPMMKVVDHRKPPLL